MTVEQRAFWNKRLGYKKVVSEKGRIGWISPDSSEKTK